MPRLLVWLATLAFGLFAPARAQSSPTPATLTAGSGANAFEQAVRELELAHARGVALEAPRVQLESLTLLAALAMVRILEADERYEPFESAAHALERAAEERWLYAGDKVARVRPEEFRAYFELEQLQRELGMWVGVADEELDRELGAGVLPRELSHGVRELVERARAVQRG